MSKTDAFNHRFSLHRKQPCEEHVWLVKDAVEIRNGVLVKKKCMVCGKKFTQYYWKETVR